MDGTLGGVTVKTNEAIALVLQSMDRSNAADGDSLCSDDGRSPVYQWVGEPLHGPGQRAPGWQMYCSRFPDHRVFHEEIFQEHNVVAAFGTSSGTYGVNGKLPIEDHWQVPAAWKAVVRNAQIAESRVHCAHQPARKLMGNNNS